LSDPRLKLSSRAADRSAVTTSASPTSQDCALEVVRGVGGVATAVFEPAPDGALLRLDLAPGAAPDEVRLAVEHVLAERFGAVAELLGERENLPSADEPGLRVDLLSVTASEEGVSASVVIAHGDARVPGRKDLPAAADGDESARARVVAEAVLLAVEELTEDAVIGTIDALEFVEDGVSVRLNLDVDGEARPAAGSSPVLLDPAQAVARAVLAAVEPHLPA
jgi:hypothetical protein